MVAGGGGGGRWRELGGEGGPRWSGCTCGHGGMHESKGHGADCLSESKLSLKNGIEATGEGGRERGQVAPIMAR